MIRRVRTPPPQLPLMHEPVYRPCFPPTLLLANMIALAGIGMCIWGVLKIVVGW